MTLINTPPDVEWIDKSAEVEAIQELQEAVITAFAHHDRDLRAEVEKVNSRIFLLLGVVALAGAVSLLWPHNKHK